MDGAGGRGGALIGEDGDGRRDGGGGANGTGPRGPVDVGGGGGVERIFKGGGGGALLAASGERCGVSVAGGATDSGRGARGRGATLPGPGVRVGGGGGTEAPGATLRGTSAGSRFIPSITSRSSTSSSRALFAPRREPVAATDGGRDSARRFSSARAPPVEPELNGAELKRPGTDEACRARSPAGRGGNEGTSCAAGGGSSAFLPPFLLPF
ncbi:MAG TPA: hypothetical protein VHM70_08940 [Polyangiaceae bacterium]|jgi:hypothetical protein|nr:hypothetical protein [Polyangiaceae bacterium]